MRVHLEKVQPELHQKAHSVVKEEVGVKTKEVTPLLVVLLLGVI